MNNFTKKIPIWDYNNDEQTAFKDEEAEKIALEQLRHLMREEQETKEALFYIEEMGNPFFEETLPTTFHSRI